MKKKPSKKPFMVKAANLSAYYSCRHFFLDRFESEMPKYQKILKESFRLRQIHSAKVHFNSGQKSSVEGDGIISGEKIYLAIKTADCLPLFFYHPPKKLIGAVHAGWRGLLMGIIENTLKKFILLKVPPQELIVAMGPHIQKCCYQVGKEISARFKLKYSLSEGIFKRSGSKSYFDLSLLARQILEKGGVKKANIEVVPICTAGSDEFYSYRRDKNDKRNLNLIGLI